MLSPPSACICCEKLKGDKKVLDSICVNRQQRSKCGVMGAEPDANAVICVHVTPLPGLQVVWFGSRLQINNNMYYERSVVAAGKG